MAWINYRQRSEQLKQQIAARAAQGLPAKESEAFYDENELGLLSDADLEAWISTSQSETLGRPTAAPAPSYSDSDAYQIRKLRWLMNNAETVADKELARQRYHETLFDLWRKHLALTGETYYKGLREEIWERYQAIQQDLG
jgi:hypothetical protein